jgi:hypothetical protein
MLQDFPRAKAIDRRSLGERETWIREYPCVMERGRIRDVQRDKAKTGKRKNVEVTRRRKRLELVRRREKM